MTVLREIFLKPGDWHFRGPDLLLCTLLGSCIAITLWHPQRRIGGMFRFLLPHRAAAQKTTLEGRYGEEAVAAMHQAGARTLAQDEESCVVFGMPKEAIRLEAADEVLPLANIPSRLALLTGQSHGS